MSSHKRKKRRPAPAPELAAAMGRLSDAIAVIACATRALEAAELRGTGDTVVVFRVGCAELEAAYNDLDAAGRRRGGGGGR